MRFVIALGGNALLKRGEALSAENQRANMRGCAEAIASICDGHEALIVHGNGPQVGLLALQAAAYESGPPLPLDVLGAESQGMIGYVIAQEMRNVRPRRHVAALITQTLVDPTDKAFGAPSKPIGPVYRDAEADVLARSRGWKFTGGADGRQRVVASPRPLEIVEQETIGNLVDAGVIVICAGGGGVPVKRTAFGALEGVEAVVDKDFAAALLAVNISADRLIILTDVDAVFRDWGRPQQSALREVSVAELDPEKFAPGSMGPKVAAALDFVRRTGKRASIGALSNAGAVLAGSAGTLIHP